ncbi:MAG TPA: hypothetical protein VGD80_40975 [Kofleriaceae bacterium]
MTTALLGCGGGFYRVDDKYRLTPAAPDEPLGELSYVTATINLRNSELLTQPMYAGKRDGKLVHAYIYAQFPGGAAGAPSAIPLFLIDFEHGSIVETQGAELLSRYPISPDARGAQVFDIQTRALKATAGDTALKIWQLSSSLAEKVTKMAVGEQTAPLFDVLNKAASLLENLASIEHSHLVHVTIPRDYSRREYADVRFILPTDNKANYLVDAEAAAQAVLKSATVSLCGDIDDRFLCVDNAPYTKLAYLIVDFKLREYLADPVLLDVRDDSCTLTSDAVRAARSWVEQPGVLSSAQRALEQSVNGRAERLLAVRAALSGQKLATAVDAYDDYRQIPRTEPAVIATPLYQQHFARRIAALDRCIAAEARRIPGNDAIAGLLARVDAEMDFGSLPEQALEEHLIAAASYLPDGQGDPLAFLTTTGLYQRAAGRIMQANKTLYQRFYRLAIQKLDVITAKRVPSQEGDALAAELEKRLATTACDRCRTTATTSVASYRALQSPSGAERVMAVASASAVAAELRLARAREERIGGEGRDRGLQGSDVARMLAAVEAATRGLVAISPERRSETSAAIAKLNATTSAARGVVP